MIRDDFEILGIAPTDDVKAIMRAYAGKVKQCHPEDDPLNWQRLHDAYLHAKDYASGIGRLHDAYSNAKDYASGIGKDFGDTTIRQDGTKEKEPIGRPGEYDELFGDLFSTVSEKSEQKDRVIAMLDGLPGQCVQFRQEQEASGCKDQARVEKRVQVWCACKLKFLFGSADYKMYRMDQEVFGALILLSEDLSLYGKYTTAILEEEFRDIAQTAEGIGRTDISRTAREARNNLQNPADEPGKPVKKTENNDKMTGNLQNHADEPDKPGKKTENNDKTANNLQNRADEPNKPGKKTGISDKLTEFIAEIVVAVPIVILFVISLEEENFLILFVGMAALAFGICLLVSIPLIISKYKKHREPGKEAEDAACIRKALSAEERFFIENNEPTIEMMMK